MCLLRPGGTEIKPYYEEVGYNEDFFDPEVGTVRKELWFAVCYKGAIRARIPGRAVYEVIYDVGQDWTL